MKVTREFLCILTAAALASPGIASAGPTDAQKCEAAKLSAAGKYEACRLSAEAVAVSKSLSPDFTKCDETYSGAWSKPEMAYATCPTTGDASTVQTSIVALIAGLRTQFDDGSLPDCAADVTDSSSCSVDLADCNSACPTATVLATGQARCGIGTTQILDKLGPCQGGPQDGDLHLGRPRAYVDNGDGTVTDANTGLMWEKLSSDGSVHDQNGTFRWYNAFNDKIAALNTGNFAGHNDWRLPNANELLSLVDFGRTSPAINPAFDIGCVAGCNGITCSCTKRGEYWTSTPWPQFASAVMEVDFDAGRSFDQLNDVADYVRAVRGG